MIFDGHVHQLPDIDPIETQEWLDSLDAVVDQHGKTRARYLLSRLMERANESQVSFPATVSTPFSSTKERRPPSSVRAMPRMVRTCETAAEFSARYAMLSTHSGQAGVAASRNPAISSRMNGDHTIIEACPAKYVARVETTSWAPPGL